MINLSLRISLTFLFLFVMAAGCGSTAMMAQRESSESKPALQGMEWTYCNIIFKIPTTFKASPSDGSHYTGRAGDIAISIKPAANVSVSNPANIALVALNEARVMNKTIINKMEIPDLNGLKGYCFYAAATFNKKPLHLLVAGFLNPLKMTAFTVQYSFFSHGEDIDKKNMEYCVEMLGTFQPIKDTAIDPNSMTTMLAMMKLYSIPLLSTQWELARTEIDIIHLNYKAVSYRELLNHTYKIVAFGDSRLAIMKLSIYKQSNNSSTLIDEISSSGNSNLCVIEYTPKAPGDFVFVLEPQSFTGVFEKAHYGLMVFYRNETGAQGTTGGIAQLFDKVDGAVPALELNNEIVRIEVDVIGTQKTSQRRLDSLFTYDLLTFSNIDMHNFQFRIEKYTRDNDWTIIRLRNKPTIENGVLRATFNPQYSAPYRFTLISNNSAQNRDNYYCLVAMHEIPKPNLQ